MPEITIPKTAYQLRKELAEAEKREKKEAMTGVLEKFIEKYEGKYFWFKREYKNINFVGMVHLKNFKIDQYVDTHAPNITYNSREIRLGYTTQKPSKWSYGTCPLVEYESDRSHSCHTYEVPYHVREMTREATKAEWNTLLTKLKQVTEENYQLFSGDIHVPDLEPGDRLITTGEL